MGSDERRGGPPAGHPGGPGRAGGSFEAHYASGTPPWDIGRPQPEMVALEEAGTFGRRVIDVGCGTGETSLFLASRGHEVVGIDAAPTAIERARAKAEERGVEAGFVLGDVLQTLPTLGTGFDAVVDVGFFHALSDIQRAALARELAEALAPGGVYAMLCFSDRVPGAFGPRRVSASEIRATFEGEAFRVRDVRPAGLVTAIEEMPSLDANLALVERL